MTRFTALQRGLHWLLAVCLLGMLFVGVFMVSTVAPVHSWLVSLHEPFGILILALALFRLGVRAVRGAPPLPRDLPAPIRLGAHLSHIALYAAMIAMPLIGWGMESAAGVPIHLFGGVVLPPILPQDAGLHALLRSAHTVVAFLFFGLILLHIAAALFHALIRRDDVFHTMAP